MLNRRKQALECDDNQAQDEKAHLLTNDPSYDYDNQISNPIPTTSGFQYPYGTASTVFYNLPIPSQRKRDKSPETPYYGSNNNDKLTQLRYVNNSHPSRRLETNNISTNKFYGESYELGTASGNFYSNRSTDYNVTIKQQPPIDFIYYTVQPGDTLQNLSVKYSCPVASIKRLNNLWSDQEFYGLAKIKLPAGKLRLIADVIDEENLKVTSSIQTISEEAAAIDASSSIPQATGDIDQSIYLGDRHSDTLNNLNTVGFDTIESKIETKTDSIFKDYDLSIAKARTAARFYDNNANAILQSLAESGNIVDDRDDPNKMARREAETLFNDMTDYGMSYSGLILFIFIVCLICPLAYVIYLEETHHDSNKTP